MSDFTFVPRKLSKLAKRERTYSSQLLSTRISAGPSLAEHPDTSQPGQPSKEKYLDDHAYAALLCLALSDYTLWSDPDFRQTMDFGEGGYVSLSHLLHATPVLANLAPRPPETTLMRSVRMHASHHLEGRMVVAEPERRTWYDLDCLSAESGGGGGYELRRKDWDAVRHRIRRYTTMQWEQHTIYIENIPQKARSIHSIYRLLHELLLPTTDTQPRVQRITFPPHRDDSPTAPTPPKCRGFTFVILTHSRDAEYLLEQWPWDSAVHHETHSSGSKDNAANAGFRCLSKRQWDKLKAEYLAYQQELLELSMQSNGPDLPHDVDGEAAGRIVHIHDTQERPPNTNGFIAPPAPLPPPPLSYPPDCLAFVKNLHTETNKTTLRTLFSAAFDGKSDGIDYVDFSKGMDACYLRLATPTHAKSFIAYFSSRGVVQKEGLDGIGITSPEKTSTAIAVELIQGKREEIYWEKVPEKIKKQAINKAHGRVDESADAAQGDEDEPRKPKRKKRNRG